MNTPFLTFVLCMIKDFSISFSRVIIDQDFETVTFYVLFVYKPIFSVIFCLMKRLHVSSQFNSLFILYISIAKPFCSCKGVYRSEDKQTRNLVSFDPANFEMSKICHLAQLFLDTSAAILQKKSEIIEKNVFQL